MLHVLNGSNGIATQDADASLCVKRLSMAKWNRSFNDSCTGALPGKPLQKMIFIRAITL